MFPEFPAIEAYLSIVFAALAIARRHLQNATGLSIKKIVQTLRPIQADHPPQRWPRTRRRGPDRTYRRGDPRRARDQRSLTHPGGTSQVGGWGFDVNTRDLDAWLSRRETREVTSDIPHRIRVDE
ncbi:hypothetical protein GCM10027600_34650 [Nocardioides ginsengisegetis]